MSDVPTISARMVGGPVDGEVRPMDARTLALMLHTYGGRLAAPGDPYGEVATYVRNTHDDGSVWFEWAGTGPWPNAAVPGGASAEAERLRAENEELRRDVQLMEDNERFRA